MEIWIDRLTATFGGYLPRLLAALAVLVVGWLVALVITSLVRAVLRRTTIDNRLAAWLQGDREGKPPQVEGMIGRIVFWLLMAMVLLAFFQVLGLAFVAGPIAGLLDEVFGFLPNLLSAGVLLALAWLTARVLRFLVERGAKAANLDERLAKHTEPEPETSSVVVADGAGAVAAPPRKTPALSKTLGETVYWLTFLLFLPAVLGALQLTGLLEPVNGLVDKILGFLPNILAAGLILMLGWLGARILQRVVSSLLAAAGVDRFGHSIGVSTERGGKSLSSVIGLVLYVLVLLPVIVAALNALAIDAVTRPASEMLNRIMLSIPQLFAAGVVILLAYFIGKVLASVVSNLLAGIGFDRFLERIGLVRAGAAEAPSSETMIRRSPSQVVGYVVMAGLLLFATIEALSLLQFELLATMVTEFTMFAGNVLLGALIFVVGYYLAGLAAGLIRSSNVAQSDLLARVAQAAVVILASVMALRQAGLAEDVILLAFGLTLGALAVAAAIAFGIGGRELAARYLERWTGKGGSTGAPRPPVA